MALGNEARTEPRIAKLEVSEARVRRIMADAGGLSPLPRPLHILLNGPSYGAGHYRTGGMDPG